MQRPAGILIVVLRLVLAVLVAPLAVLPAILLAMAVFAVVFDSDGFEIWLNVQLFAPIGLYFAYVAAFLIGVPANLLLRWRGFASIAAHACVGAVVGLFVALFVFRLYETPLDELAVALTYGYLLVSCSTIVAAAFGAIAGGRQRKLAV